MNKNTVLSDIRKLGWNAIQLSKKGYRGAIQSYKSIDGSRVPILFYIDECFIIEDKQGLFRVEDLKDFFFKHKEVDLEATGCIEGLSLIAYLEKDNINYMDSTLTRLGINNRDIRDDIESRLRAVNQLGEMEDVDMGF